MKFNHLTAVSLIFSEKSIKCHPKSVQVVKKGISERLNYFSISRLLGHKPNYPLRLVIEYEQSLSFDEFFNIDERNLKRVQISILLFWDADYDLVHWRLVKL